MTDKKKVIPANLEMLEFESGVADVVVTSDVRDRGYVEIEQIKFGDFTADMSGQPGEYCYIVRGDSGEKYELGATNVVNLCAELNQFDANKLPTPLLTQEMKRKLKSKQHKKFYTRLNHARTSWAKKQADKSQAKKS